MGNIGKEKNVSFLRIMEITLLTRHQWLIHKPDHHAYSHLQQGIINPPPPLSSIILTIIINAE